MPAMSRLGRIGTHRWAWVSAVVWGMLAATAVAQPSADATRARGGTDSPPAEAQPTATPHTPPAGTPVSKPDRQVPPATTETPEGKPAATQPPASPAVEPPATPTPLQAVVIEVRGIAHWSKQGVSVFAGEGWTPLAVGDRLEPGTQIRTALRAHVNLQFGKTTFVSIRPVSLTSIDAAYRSAVTETIRLGLGYGTIRGASSEGELRADVRVSSPVVTLAKRGTEGWQISVEAQTGRFDISLAESGLIEALQTARGEAYARTVRPGEYVNERTIANLWLTEATFTRTVALYNRGELTRSEALAAGDYPGGYAALGPAAGTELVHYSARRAGSAAAGLTAQERSAGSTTVIVHPVQSRPEGNFGTGPTFRGRTGR